MVPPRLRFTPSLALHARLLRTAIGTDNSHIWTCPTNSRRLLSTSDPLPDYPSPPLQSSTIAPNAANDEVARLAAQPLPPLTLKDLVRHGYPPLTSHRLLSSARYTRNILPLRLARRILALRNLPFIIVSNPHISEIYNNYIHSLRLILSTPPNHPTTLAEESAFTKILTEIVATHANTIPTLAKGFIECRKYIGPDEVTSFLERHLRARIGTRLLAEQHIALREQSVGKDGKPLEVHRWQGRKGDHDDESSIGGEDKATYIGTIDTEMLPTRIISSCSAFVGGICELRYGIRPRLIIEGHTNVKFPYIPVHLEYIITELLKNAFRATIETPTSSNNVIDTDPIDSAEDDGGDPSLPPVIVTIAVTNISTPSDSTREKVLSIRIRDRGGGISPDILPDIWKYSFTTYDRDRGKYNLDPSPPSAPSALPSTSSPSSSIPSYYGGGIDSEPNPMNMNLGMGGIGGGGVGGVGGLGDIVDLASAGAGGGSIAGLGYGLPLSRAYAEYFGGNLKVQSCFGWGTDVYLMLKGVDVEDID